MKVLLLFCSGLLFLGIQSTIPTEPLPPSTCWGCKSVTGSGPLTGEYFLVDTQEDGCVEDGCAYTRLGHGEDRYCFVKEDGLYTASECEESLPTTEAPFMKIIKNVIEENGEIYEQVDSYNNETGEVSIEVPPHGDREPIQILMDPIGDTLVANTISKCQVKSLPDGVDPHSLASSGDEVGSRDEAITEDTEDVKHSITIDIAEATKEDLDKLSSAAYSACVNKKVVLTEEKSVTGEVFENLTNGGIIDIGPDNGRRKRDLRLGNCSSTRMCGARTSGCWRWPYGTSFSIHHLNLDVLCVECCEDGGSTPELCPCSDITSLQQLEQCTTPDEGSCPDGFYSCEGQCKVEVGAPTDKCNGTCPQSRVPCGDLCIPSEWSSNLYDHYKQWIDCNGQCVKGDTPCNGTCPDGKTACGDRCVSDSYVNRWYRLCDGVCITDSVPCNGECQDGKVLCGDRCRQDDGNWRPCEDACIYKTEACDGMCPKESSLCGNSTRCITADDQSFKQCNGDCIPYLTPCNNVCPNGTISCGDECIQEDDHWRYKECNGKCIYYSDPCNGECPDSMLLCQYSDFYMQYGPGEGSEVLSRTSHGEGHCIWDDDSTYKCGDICKQRSQKCNGSCSEGWISCGQEDSGSYDYGNYENEYYEGYSTECIKNGSSYYQDCNGTCLQYYEPCDGKCQDGYYNCEGWCQKNYYNCRTSTGNICPEGWDLCGKYNCMKEGSTYSLHRSCGDRCIGKYEACNGTCPEGMDVCGYSYGDLLCYSADSTNQPCNGICMTNGTACEGHCPDGFTVCTLGHTFYNDQQVCYNDSDQSLFYLYNGYCWHKQHYH